MSDEVTHESGLIWWPMQGMGFYPVPPSKMVYDQSYWDKYVGYAATPMGRQLNRLRLDLVKKWINDAPLVDIGIGCGQFLLARGVPTYGYDVNPVAIEWLQLRDLWVDPYKTAVKHASFFDSLEHVPDPAALVARVKGTIFVSTPIYKSMEDCLASKHFRKDEHYWYWTSWGLVMWMSSRGFFLRYEDRMETEAGRDSIGTFVFSRRGA